MWFVFAPGAVFRARERLALKAILTALVAGRSETAIVRARLNLGYFLAAY